MRFVFAALAFAISLLSVALEIECCRHHTPACDQRTGYMGLPMPP